MTASRDMNLREAGRTQNLLQAHLREPDPVRKVAIPGVEAQGVAAVDRARQKHASGLERLADKAQRA